MPLADKTTTTADAAAFVPLPRPGFVLPLQSTVTGFSHSTRKGTSFTVCISVRLAAQLFLDDADIWQFVQRQAEVQRYYLPCQFPQIDISALPLESNPEGMYGDTLQVLCTWPPKRGAK